MDIMNYNHIFVKTMDIEKVTDYKRMLLVLATITTAMRDDKDVDKDEICAFMLNAFFNGSKLFYNEDDE